MEYEDDGAVAVAAPKPYSSFIPSLGNFSVQFNLQVASMAVTLMVTSQDTYISKTMHVSADFPEPQWAKDALKGIVFAGAFAGMISMGYLGDLLGRRIGMMATLSLVVFGALGSAIAPWLGDANTVYLALTILRFILGMGVGGIYPMAAASASEAGGGEASANEHGEDEEGIMRTAKAFFWQAPGAAAPYLVSLLSSCLRGEAWQAWRGVRVRVWEDNKAPSPHTPLLDCAHHGRSMGGEDGAHDGIPVDAPLHARRHPGMHGARVLLPVG